MDLLWQKESNKDDALFIDVFENVTDKNEYVYQINETHAKSDQLAVAYREKGNEEFQVKHWVEAMNLYSKSLGFAQNDSENISLAYANRSTCFLRMNLYEKCLIDIDLAIKAKYPDNLMPKLEKRRKDCLKLMKNDDQYKENVPKLSYKANENYPALANIVNIEPIDGFGRCIVAKGDIDVGKTIFVEEAFASRKLSREEVVCTICMKSLANFIPCEQCSSATFCSNACKNETNIHKMECGFWLDTYSDWEFIERLIFIGFNLFSNTDDWMHFVENSIKNSNAVPISLHDVKSRYQALLQLNIVHRKDFLVKDLSSARQIFLRLLHRDFIKKAFDTERKERLLRHVILQHIRAISSNGYEHFEKIKNAFIILSYFNHSCVPNTFLFYGNNGNKAIGITLRPIKNGDQLFVTYAGGHSVKPVDRTYLLQNFGFDCKCERCEPKTSVSATVNLNLDREYQNIIRETHKRPLLDFKGKKLVDLKRKYVKLLQKYGKMHYCNELGTLMMGFATLIANGLRQNL